MHAMSKSCCALFTTLYMASKKDMPLSRSNPNGIDSTMLKVTSLARQQT